MESKNTKSIILTCYYRPKPGGLCKRLFRAIESLLAAGHDVHYLAVAPFPIKHVNCYFHRFPWPPALTDNLAFWAVFHLFSPLILLYIGIRYRVTHTFAFGSTYSLFLQPIRLIKNIPHTLFLRGDLLESHRIKGRHRWLIGLEKHIEGLGIAGVRLYGVTKILTEKVVARHPILKPSHYGILRNDIETSDIAKAEPKKPTDMLRLGCVGTLDEGKNLALALQCIGYLKDRQCHLYIYGIGPAEQSLRNMAKNLGISSKVSFMGWVSMTSKIWERIDVLIFPSLHEGSPNAILEAIANCIPVLASDIPEHREILPHGDLIAKNSLEPWISAIEYFLKDPASTTQELAHNQSRHTQILRFDWNSRIRELILN